LEEWKLVQHQVISFQLSPDAADAGVRPILVNVLTRIRDEFDTVESQASDDVYGLLGVRAGREAMEIPTHATDPGPSSPLHCSLQRRGDDGPGSGARLWKFQLTQPILGRRLPSVADCSGGIACAAAQACAPATNIGPPRPKVGRNSRRLTLDLLVGTMWC